MAAKVPNALIKRLQGLGPHFCLVKAYDKNPSVGGKGWQKQENLMFADDPKLQAHLKKGGNYGVVGGFGLVIADADTPETKQILEEKLPETFTVESPGSHGWHAYFLCGLEKPIRLRDKDGENVGDIQGPGKMVVGPNSIHPNGGVYKVVKDMPLAQVTAQELREALKDWIVPEKEIEQIEAAARREKQETRIDLDILQVVPLSGLHKRGSEYFGPHPIHGSNTKQNFWVNPSKNCWHCFRHGSGGGPLLWLAVEEGIIHCSEAGAGALRGETFKRVLEKAQERGLIEKNTLALEKEKGQTKQDFGEIISQITGKDVFVILLRTLSHTVKRDHYAKQFDLLHCTSAYCNPINELKDAPTSEGKTYPLVQAVKLFPPEDVMLLGGLSPTALAHDYGELIDDDYKPLEPKIMELNEKIEKLELEGIEAKRGEKAKIRIKQKQIKKDLTDLYKTAKVKINLENKIIVFLENPHQETWAKLRPIMSHDKWRIEYQITDRLHNKAPLKKVKTVIEGWPVFIAFKAESENPEIWNQILSRGTNVPVEMSKAKYRAGVNLEALKRGLPQTTVNRKLHKRQVKQAQQIVRAVKKRLLEIKDNIRKQTGMDEVPNMFWIPFYRKIGAGFPAEIGMHMRESQRFLTAIQMHAAINVYARPILEIDGVEYIICTLEDYRRAFHLFFGSEAKSVIFSKLPKHKVDFFEKVLLPLWKAKRKTILDDTEVIGITSEEMRKKYFEAFKKTISSNTINYHYLQVLEDMNFISRSPDPSNKSRKLTVVLTESVSSEKSPIETHFENGDVLSLKELKEAFSQDFQVVYQKPPLITIKTYKNEELSLDELYAQFFYSRRRSLHTTSKPMKKPTIKEKKLVETPVLETGGNGGLFVKTESEKLEELILCIKDKQHKNNNPMIERSFIEAKIKELAFVNDTETVFQHLYKNGAVSEIDVIDDLGGSQ